jgi:hypothetical protein
MRVKMAAKATVVFVAARLSVLNPWTASAVRAATKVSAEAAMAAACHLRLLRRRLYHHGVTRLKIPF